MPSTPIDSLDIQIKTSADTAEKSLDKLVNTIGKISASLGGVNFNGFAQGVKNLSSAMQSLQNVKMPDYTRLANGIAKIGTINSSQIQQAGVAIRELSGSLKYLDSINVSDNSKQIAELANGIAKLGYKSSTQAITNIPKLATAMRELMATLSTAPKVSQNIIDMTNALAKLSRTGASSGRAATSLGKALDIYTASTNRASKGSWSLAGAIGKLYATYWLLFRAFGKIGDAIDISSSLTEVQNVVDVTFGEYASLVEKMSETSIADFGMSELTVKQVASRFQAMGSAMGFAQGKMADMSIELTKLTADMASFYNVEQADVAEDLESIFTGQTRPLRTYGLDLTEATLKEWAMKQGLDANIDSMSQMEKTMLRYQYVMANTGAAQGDFLRTADTWANQTRILKQNFEQLGAIIGGTFINMLKPLVKALNNVMSHIIAFAETVSNALGKIFGWKYEVGGGGVTSDLEDGEDAAGGIADGVGDAADNAKKLKQQLQGFDELNVLTTTQDTSASGGGTGTGGGGTGGQWVEQDSIFKEFESEIDTLYELGEAIRDALIGAMESIDWDAVYEKARGFGKGLAEFLNGLLAYDGEGRTLFGEVGKTLANTLNTIVYSAQSFAKEFDFHQFGVNLADGINKFFENFDFKALAETINTLFKGAIETATTLLQTTDFEMIGEKIGEFLVTLDLSGFVSGIAEKIWETIKAGFEFLDGLFDEAPLEATLLLTFSALKFTKLGTFISQKIASSIASTLGLEIAKNAGIKTALLAGLNSMGGIFGTGISALFGSKAAESALAFMNPLMVNITGIVSVLGGAFTAILNFIDMLNEGFSWANEIFMLLGIGITAVGAVILGAPALIAGVVATIVASVGTLVVVIKDNWGAITQWFSDVATAIGTFFVNLWEKIKEIAGNIATKFVEMKNNVVRTVSEFASKVALKFTEIKDGAKKKIEELRNNVSEIFEKIREKISEVIGSISEKFSDFKNSVQGVIDKIRDFFSFNGKKFDIKLPSMDDFINGLKGAIDKLKEFFGFNGKEVTVNTSVGGVDHSGGGAARGNAVSNYSLDTSFFGSSYTGKLNGVNISNATVSALDSGVGTANSGIDYETKSLLNEILSEIRNGHVIKVDRRELGRTVRDEDASFYNRTGRSMFQHT